MAQVKVDYFFSMMSSYAAIGHEVFHDLCRRRAVTVNFMPVKLLEVFAGTGGLPLGQRHEARRAYRLLELRRWARERNLDFNVTPKYFPFDASLADRVVVAIVDSGADPTGFMGDVFRAIWARERDLADGAELARLLTRNGFDADAVITRAGHDDMQARYERNTRQAIAAGAIGSPVYVLNGEPFWGQDRLDMLEEAIVSKRAPFTL